MDFDEFRTKVDAHPDLFLCGVGHSDGREPAIYIQGLGRDGRRARYRLEATALETNRWDEIEQVLTGKRDPQVLRHVTRILGYYSELRNWNRSKLAELRDRRRGNYAVPETSVAGAAVRQDLPADVVDEQLAGHAARASCQTRREDAAE